MRAGLAFSVAALGAVLLGGCAGHHMEMESAAMAPAKTEQTGSGPVLADGKGMTLYVFDKDTAGMSSCNGPCAHNWPPLMAEPGSTASGDWTTIKRGDGTMQWAYKGRPLYTWIKDQKPGDATGDGFMNGAWHAARP